MLCINISTQDTVPVPAGELAGYVTEELNVSALHSAAPDEYGTVSVEPNFRALGARLGPAMKSVAAAAKALSKEDIESFQKEGTVTVAGLELGPDDVRLHVCAWPALQT